MLKDPVCNINVHPSKDYLTYKNKKYFFCSEHCRRKFSQNPEKFLQKQRNNEASCSYHQTPVLPNSSSATTVIYTCPMHPDIEQVNFDSCPKCGMSLKPKEISLQEDNSEYLDMRQKFWWSLFFTFPLFFLEMGSHGNLSILESFSGRGGQILQLGLASPVLLWCGGTFFIRAWNSIMSKSLNMFVLITLGTSIAYLYSLIALVSPQLFPTQFLNKYGVVNVYFETASAIVSLVLLGQILELKARSKTNGAIKSLLELSAKKAIKIDKKGLEKEIDIELVQIGDLLKIKPGDKIPVDGIIIRGKTYIDEAMITGESSPVIKEENSTVIGSTINQQSSFIMRAEKVGKETFLSQIVQVVSNSQRSHPPIQKMVDKVSAVFVPIVMIISLISFFLWYTFGPEPRLVYAFINAVAVLVIACPCALGLATPMSIMVGMGKGAKAGILIKDAEALECLKKVKTLVIDKTGTLTEGKPKLLSVISQNVKENELLSWMASLEKESEHPLARAIFQAAKEKNLKIPIAKDFKAIMGQGVIAKINNKRVVLGNRKLLEKELLNKKCSSFDELLKKAEILQKQKQTVMYAIIDGELVGLLGVADPIKKTSLEAIKKIKKMGIEVVMLTGDNRTAAEIIAKELGIKKVIADVLPVEKVNVIKELQRSGKIVAMAGDGINDAPALAQSNVGIAMGNGTSIAIETAKVILIKGDLISISKANQLSKATTNNIRQNLFFAFFYNAIGVPIAAGALYPVMGVLLSPLIAAMAMSFSSFSVTVNALRLNRLKL